MLIIFLKVDLPVFVLGHLVQKSCFKSVILKLMKVGRGGIKLYLQDKHHHPAVDKKSVSYKGDL